ncbi:MAG: hypothetical protein GY851_10865 [bacterium]|nr:hypothetical protein [bacterium]
MKRDVVRASIWSLVVVMFLAWIVMLAVLHVQPDPALRCVLIPGAHEFRPEGHILRFNVRVENRAGRTIHLPKAITGSDYGNGSRYPHCAYQVYLPFGNGMAWQVLQAPLDYGTRFVEPEDFFEVPADGVFNPFAPEEPTKITIARSGRDFPPGEYRIRLVYRTNPSNEEEWYSYCPSTGDKPNPSDQLLRLIRDTPRGEFISNEVVVTVPPAPTP